LRTGGAFIQLTSQARKEEATTMMKNPGGKLKVISLALATVALLLMAATGVVRPAKLSPIKIGAAGPYTGDVSKIGLDGLNAIRMAVDEANATGGIGGRKIEIVEADDAADPSKAILVAERLAMDRAVIGVVGPMNSATCPGSPAHVSKSGPCRHKPISDQPRPD